MVIDIFTLVGVGWVRGNTHSHDNLSLMCGRCLVPKLLKALTYVLANKEAPTEKPSRGTNTTAINQPV